jgi:amidase
MILRRAIEVSQMTGTFEESSSSASDTELDFGSIARLSDAMRARKISASELLENTIARIEALDGRINAVVVRDFDRAREAAKAAEKALARGEQRALLGIPVTLKEPFNVAGLPTTFGFPQFRDFVPTEDALVVSRLKRAGAIIIGKTNIPMGLRDFQSYNDIYGTTNNPWDLGRSPGGSSGGCAAALAAGFGPLSIGSDIGGSIRVPAHFCGIFGHKPTLGLIPQRGYGMPPAPPNHGIGDLAVVGPMARTAADLSLALDVIAGPDETHEGVGYRLALPAARHDSLKDFRVLVIDTHPLMPAGRDVRTAIGDLAERLVKAGAKVARSATAMPSLETSARLYMKLLNAARSPRLLPDQFAEAQRFAQSIAPDDQSLEAERARGWVMTQRDWLAANAARLQMQVQWRTFFREFDVVVYPSAAIPAFVQDQSEPIEARHVVIDGKSVPYLDAFFIWADPATTCGLPATAVPVGLSPSGLPIGVQIIGPFLEDRTPLAFAALMEREFGGFIPPPGLAAAA